MGRRVRAYRTSVTLGITAAMVLSLAGPANAAVSETIVFNNPSVDNGKQIQDTVDSVINAMAAKKSGDLRVAIYNLDSKETTQALIDAAEAGVHVKVIANFGPEPAPSSTNPSPFEKMWNAINGTASGNSYASVYNKMAAGNNVPDPTTDNVSWVVMCRHACIGNGNSVDPNSINHQKFVLADPDTVISSSANMLDTTDGLGEGHSGNAAWNNAVELTGDATIYSAFQNEFLAMKHGFEHFYAGKTGIPAPSVPAGVTSNGRSVDFYPQPNGGDPYMGLLAGFTQQVCQQSHRSVEVAQSEFRDVTAATQLHKIASWGCNVLVVYTDNPAPNQTAALAALNACSVPSRIRVWSLPKGAGMVHSKYMIAGANVLTGSVNMLDAAYHIEDNTLEVLSDANAYLAYLTNFNTLTTVATAQQC